MKSPDKDCRAFENQLDGLLAGRLTSEQRALAEQHAALCSPCRELYSVAQGNQAAISRAVPEDLTSAILARTSGSACRRAHELLPSFADGELPVVDARLVRLHTEHCPECESLTRTLGWLTGQLRSMGEREPGPQFTADVLVATTRSRWASPDWWSRWQEWWHRQIIRPRFALEAAYVGTMILVALCATPVSPFRDASPRALEVVEAGPARVGGLLEDVAIRAGSELSDWGRGAWQQTGAGAVSALNTWQESLARRHRRAQPAVSRLQSHAADLGQALTAIDFGQAALALSEMRQDLRRAWQLWQQDTTSEKSPSVSLRGSRKPHQGICCPVTHTSKIESPRA